MHKSLSKENLTIAFIGAGKITHTLIPALLNAGYSVDSIFSRSKNSARDAAHKFKFKNYSDNISEFSNRCNFIFIAVPDNQIKIVAEELSKQELDFTKIIIVHLSGSKTIKELESLKIKGAATASFHIMQTFPNKDIAKIKNAHAAIETGNKEIENILFTVAADLKLLPFKISSGDKVLYHLLGVFTSNFLAANFFNAEKIGSRLKSNIPRSSKLLYPTALQTLKNIRDKGSVNALSGPIERGELEVIKSHLEQIKDDHFLSLSYITQSLSLLEIASLKSSIDNKKYIKIKDLLKTELRKHASRF